MSNFQNIKRELLPLFKGIPFIAASFVIALFIAFKVVKYSTPMYQSVAKIKLDDQNYGFSNNNLYKDFDVFSTANKIESEVEVLKSPLLINEVLDKLNFEISYNRVGKLKTTSLYKNCPFTIYADVLNNAMYGEEIGLIFISEVEFELQFNDEIIKGKVNQKILAFGIKLLVKVNTNIIEEQGIDLIDKYSFVINSRDDLIKKITGELLDVKAIDKEVAVLRVVYQDPVAERSADFVNFLCDAYINDYVKMKTSAAEKTVEFIDSQIYQIGNNLKKSESKLERYKLKYNIVNTYQESETGLRELSKLKIQLINMEMNVKAIQSLDDYMGTGDYFNELAVNVGYGDLLMTEMVKKLKHYNDVKQDLLLKYTPESDEVIANQVKINEVKKYVKESIKRAKNDLVSKKEEVKNKYKQELKQFDNFPTREKELNILERNFHLNESVYKFLSQKRTEASIAAAALISFHRIIQKGMVSKKPTSPNKTLIVFVSGLLSLIISISIIYLIQFISSSITDRVDLEKIVSTEIIGVVKKTKGEDTCSAVTALATNLIIKKEITSNKALLISSSVRNEGKSFVATKLAKCYAEMGYKTVLVDFNFYSSAIQTNIEIKDELKKLGSLNLYTTEQNNLSVIYKKQSEKLPVACLSNLELIRTLKNEFDVIIIDSPAAAITLDALALMRVCDEMLYVVRAGFTKKHFAYNCDLIREEYSIDNISIVLNAVHKATNFSGIYTGSKFNYLAKKRGFINVLKHYLKSYVS